MQIFQCECGAALFFHNSLCLTCRRDVGFCPACRRMTTLVEQDGGIKCGHEECGVKLQKCKNYENESVCNWSRPAGEESETGLCLSCRLTRVIPDLSQAGNKRRWAELEQAKRRMLYTLDLLGLPFSDGNGALPLRFEFKGDPVSSQKWRTVSGGEQVMTGHADGVITINIREADSVQREQSRVQFGEDLRTLIGHFRHEVGHYYWQRLVDGHCVDEFVAVFGDHRQPAYDEAMEQYYANGPKSDWRKHNVTAYASMHPWEDFAETFATYLDMAALLDTGAHAGLIPAVTLTGDITPMIESYRRLGVGVNEMNREMGLLDPAPFVFSDDVVKKLTFIHLLIQGNVGQ